MVLQQNIYEITESVMQSTFEKINNLDQDQRELIEMRFFDELSFKEIAEILDTTEANAKMKVYRILEKVKKSW